MKNHEVARILKNISILLDMDSVPFKPRAYEKAALTIEGLERDVEQFYREGGVKALKEIAEAQKEMVEAQEELSHTKKDGTPDPDYDKAIEHYKKAWEHAQHALGLEPDPET